MAQKCLPFWAVLCFRSSYLSINFSISTLFCKLPNNESGSKKQLIFSNRALYCFHLPKTKNGTIVFPLSLFLSSFQLKLFMCGSIYSSHKYNLKFKPYWRYSQINWGEIISFIFFCFSKRTDTCWDEEIWPPTRVFHEEYVCCTATELKASVIPWCTKVIGKWARGVRAAISQSALTIDRLFL